MLFHKMWENRFPRKLTMLNTPEELQKLREKRGKEAFKKVRLKLYKVTVQTIEGDIVQELRETCLGDVWYLERNIKNKPVNLMGKPRINKCLLFYPHLYLINLFQTMRI